MGGGITKFAERVSSDGVDRVQRCPACGEPMVLESTLLYHADGSFATVAYRASCLSCGNVGEFLSDELRAAEWWDPCRSCKLALEGGGRADRETWAERWKRRGAAVVGALMVALAAMVPLMFLLGAVYVVIDLTAGIWRSL